MPDLTLNIDDQKITTLEGTPLSQILADNNIHLPDLAAKLSTGQIIHTDLVEDVSVKLVKRVGEIQVKDKLKIKVNSGLARQHRQAAFRQIQQDCLQNCDQTLNQDSTYPQHPNLEQYLSYDFSDLQADDTFPLHKMAQAAELDASVCTGCNKCVEACARVGVNYLNLEGEDKDKHVVPSKDPKTDCIYCGQCTLNCPVKAAREQSQVQTIEAMLANPNLITIVQMAPSVRTSIGEEFGAEIGMNLEKQMATAFRQLGFDYVFDVNMGADITTMVEAEELTKRLKNNGTLPMFTSCCPAWVKFVEFYYPEMIPHLTNARSPQIHSGIAYKTWWAEKAGIDPDRIRVISIMPCTSKQYEARQERLKVDDFYPVDATLTTREMAYLLKKNNIDLLNLPEGKSDIFGYYSGAGAIYGASGGVMESALRTAIFMLEGKNLPRLEFEQVRGMEGIKKAEVEVLGQALKVAVATTAVNMHILIKEVKANPEAYHYVEFMACPGGCIGGGGQPIPASDKKTAQRIASLYKIDNGMKIRRAHDNPVVKEFMDYVNSQTEERRYELLCRGYEQKQKGE